MIKCAVGGIDCTGYINIIAVYFVSESRKKIIQNKQN